MNDLVSVVVPIYNVEQYLERCIDSVLRQTYSNLEIILVDDGSTDNSGSICDKYALEDKRIVVLHKVNGGLSDARNYGIEKAKGKYITFIDSDDYVSCLYIEIMMKALIDNCADISICDEKKTKLSNETECKNTFLTETEVWDSRIGIKEILLQRGTTASSCGKIYKKEYFREIKFPYGKLFEDMGTTYKIFDKAEKIVKVNRELYFYYQRENSIQGSGFSQKKMDEWLMVCEMQEFIRRKYPELKYEMISRMISTCFHILFAINDRNEYSCIVDELWGFVKKSRWIFIFCKWKHTTLKVYIGCLCSVCGLGLTQKVYEGMRIRGRLL